ncbi:MAG: branched-chain amino acid ABC transporter permease [Actinobacteria bacterium]|nr:branched-chain amino acid ABC transporter permease [Actinomycetota bacterium]
MRLHRAVTGSRSLRLVLGIVLLVLAAMPWLIDPFRLSLLAKTISFAMFALSLDLLWGIAGVFSFGHAAFFGVGAYALALITRDLSFPGNGWIGLIAAMLLPALLALGIGYFTFYGQVAGAYFAIVTLAVSLVLTQLATTWVGLTGGHNGLFPVPPLTLGIPGVAEFSFDTPTRIYFLQLALLAIALVVSIAVVRSRFGQALVAMEGNESRARFFGYDTSALKLIVFTISGAIAGLAGGTFATIEGFVNPAILGIALSTQVIIWVILGGRGTLVGPVVGATVVAFLEDYLSGTFLRVWLLVLGALLLLAVLFRPEGLLGTRRIRRLIGTR